MSDWLRLADPPRIILMRPKISTTATAAILIVMMILPMVFISYPQIT